MSSMGDSDTDGDRPLLHNGPSLFWPYMGVFGASDSATEWHQISAHAA
jgi:hypothetical protein